MRARDLFVGYSVQIVPGRFGWTVSLLRPDGRPETATEYSDRVDAMEAVDVWTVLMVDERELEGSPEEIWEILRAGALQAPEGIVTPPGPDDMPWPTEPTPPSGQIIELDRQRARLRGDGGP